MKANVAQQRRNMLKVIRAAVRLKHSIAADDELAEVLPLAQEKFDAAVLKGVLPEPPDIKKALRL